ncbi:alpha-L-fucosidase [Streptomyces sp. 6N223]|uniref:alpha-L-fucosidase n=1 Tax=Streptomyces sp. 6N223 TaxID=3457412 RepID=UPI003FD2C789
MSSPTPPSRPTHTPTRRSLLGAATLAGAAAAFGVPQALWPATASAAYEVPARQRWWYEARFGMFIHFGSYSHLGHGEWAFNQEGWTKADYQTEVSRPFNPTAYDPAAIAELAANAGMKYLVITAKHHEGYAMWDSRVPSFTDTTGGSLYNLYAYSGYAGGDLLGRLKAECEQRGVAFGLYYSILDWCHPSQTMQGSFSRMASLQARAAYITDMKAQLRELIDRYDPAILWFDGDWCGSPSSPTLDEWWIEADGRDLYDWLLSRSPDIVVNERVKRGFGLGDFDCPEQTVPAAPLERPWETCATMNGTWGYTDWAESNYRSVPTLVQELVTVVSRDGNYLLNIGPRGDGAVPEGSVAVLDGFAAWMAANADSVHGTLGSPFASEPEWGRLTAKDGKLFAHVFAWPADGVLRIPQPANAVRRVSLLSAPGTPLDHATAGGTLNVTVPAEAPDAADSVVLVEVEGMPRAAGSR